jgi:DNA-binding MarR family transcriptional regulator
MLTTLRGLRADAATINRAAIALAARARAERAGVLSLNQTAVLGRLVSRGEMTPGEMAEQLRTQPQSLTRTFAALEAAGYIRRMPDPTDGRQYLLGLTASGRRAIRDEIAPRDAWVARAMTYLLDDQDRALLVRAAELMQRLADFEPGGAVSER